MLSISKLILTSFTFTLSHLLYAQVIDTALIREMISTAITQRETSLTLQTLTDSIGGRVTGTGQSKKTSSFLLKKLRGIGINNAHMEDYALKSGWVQLKSTGRIISPADQPLVVGSYGWCPGTKGEIIAKVVNLGSVRFEQIPRQYDGIKGAAVLVNPISSEDHPGQVTRYTLAYALARSGAAAMLIPSDKPGRQLYTSGFGFYPVGPMPVVSIAKEDALFLLRILRHSKATVKLNINNSFNKNVSKEFNVVGDIPGTDTAGVILIGAHFDSWDYGQGAQDNGSGVAAVMEVARIFMQLGIKPKNTIRFAFFSGEEQGLLGSHAYVTKHSKELSNLKCALIMDDGAQVPKGLVIHGRTDLASILQQVSGALSPLGANGISTEASFDTDHAPFLAEGIPAFTLWVDEGDYDVHHHSATDTYDKVDAALLATDAAVLAVSVYCLDQILATTHRLSQEEVRALFRKNGLESIQKILYGAWK